MAGMIVERGVRAGCAGRAAFGRDCPGTSGYGIWARLTCTRSPNPRSSRVCRRSVSHAPGQLRADAYTERSIPTRRPSPDRSLGKIFVPSRFQSSGGDSAGDPQGCRSHARSWRKLGRWLQFGIQRLLRCWIRFWFRVKLPRFGGHLNTVRRRCPDVETPPALRAGIPASDGRAGARGPHARGAGSRV